MAHLEIDISALISNYKLLASKATEAKCAAVVKANAYGLGVAKVAASLANAGCTEFFVAQIDEAIELKQALEEAKLTSYNIYVFNGLLPTNEKQFIKHGIVPIINNYPQLQVWRMASKKQQEQTGTLPPCAIHIDTAMNRLGFEGMPPLGGINCILVLSHLANAEDAKHPINARQLAAMDNMTKRFGSLKFSFANSAGIMLGGKYHLDLLRPGIGLYGGLEAKGMSNVVTLYAKIIQIKEININQEVGYGSTHKANKGDIIATLDIGYADGINRNLSNKGVCHIEGQKAPYVGRVSMDLITIDITKLDKKLHKIGQEVEILGNDYSICDMAKDCDTISYEIITSLGQRLKRNYINA